MSSAGETPDPVALLARRTPKDQARVLALLTPPQRRELTDRWWKWAHKGQHWPNGDWKVWLIQAGRGFGKTRAGAEWISSLARANPAGRYALVGSTLDDAARVMVEGAAGLIAVRRDGESIHWSRDRGEVIFGSGARAFVYSAGTPELLRGPEHHAAWCDELGKWRAEPGAAAWDNLWLGLRAGDTPRVMVTTTPRANTLMRRVIALAEKGGVVTKGATRDNLNLPPTFVAAMVAEYGGTRLGRQELDGELIDDVPGALWSRGMIEVSRVKRAPRLVRVVVAVDPPASADGDACGIVAAGLCADGHAYVLQDASVAGLSPDGWGRAVARCAAKWRADRVVAERNQGGDMVGHVLRGAKSTLPVRLVHASRGKSARAEPVAMRYERGEVHHVGAGFAALEDELCGLQAGGGYEGPGRSPDRADAAVWALTELLLRRPAPAGVRVV